MEKIGNYEINFINYFQKDKSEKIKNILYADNFRYLEKLSYEYQKKINVIFSFIIDSSDLNREKKYEI